MDNKEVLFAKKLEEVKQIAKKQGNTIEEKQVKASFEELELSGEQLNLVYDYLKKHKIGIGEPPDPDEWMSAEESDYLDNYLESLKGFKVCSDSRKEQLIRQAMAGEKKAQEELLKIYLPYVAEIARLYTGQGVLVEDLIGEGNVAATIASSMLGCMEDTVEADAMMARMIMEAMEQAVAESEGTRRKDKEAADKVNRVADEAAQLSRELGREITAEELFRESELTLEEIEEALRVSGGQIEYVKEEPV